MNNKIIQRPEKPQGKAWVRHLEGACRHDIFPDKRGQGVNQKTDKGEICCDAVKTKTMGKIYVSPKRFF